MFRLGQNYTLAADDEVAEVVVVSGDATIEGHVYRDLVVVLGNVRLASTAVVEGDFVVVGGNAVIAEGAQVGNDLVVVGGSFDAAPGFNPDGEQIVIGPRALGRELEGIIPWITRGLLWGRPIVPDVAWVWGVVGLFFLVYLTLIVVFDRPVRVCADTLAAKPLTAFLVGLLVLLLAGPVFLLLTVSVVGIVVVPFAICALLLAWILGKVGVARWIGMSVMPESRNDSGASPRTHGMRSFTIGFLVLCVAYMIPVLGLVAWASVGVLGLGAAVAAFIAGYRTENPVPPRRVPPTEPPPATYMPVPPPMASAAASYQPPISEANHVADIPSAEPATGVPTYTPVSTLAAFPHARFRDRLAAFILDVLLVAITVELLDLDGRGVEQRWFVLMLAYHIGFWTWKGTTVGGIICQLRVIRTTASLCASLTRWCEASRASSRSRCSGSAGSGF